MKNFSFFRILPDFLYPRRCPVCDKAVKPFGSLVCEECVPKIKYVKAPYCQKCGKELKDARAVFCHDCVNRKHFYDRGMALFAYRSVSDSIYRFKYRGRQEYAAYYGERMARILGKRILELRPDALVPVPIHAAKKRQRGYNQAEVLANEVGRLLHIPVETKLIKRVQKTKPMKDLSVQERQNNLKRAFKIRQNDVKLKVIIVIDDIYTTGSTIDAVAKMLLKAGTLRVFFITLAIGEDI